MRNLSLQKNRIKLAEKEICDCQLRNAEDKELFCRVKVFCIDKCFQVINSPDLFCLCFALHGLQYTDVTHI